MSEQEEKSKKKPSLGVVIEAKRQDITDILKGGYYPSETIDATKEMHSDISSQGSNDVIESRESIDKGKGEDVCDGFVENEANEADAGRNVNDDDDKNSNQK
jgi:hypothetical protein